MFSCLHFEIISFRLFKMFVYFVFVPYVVWEFGAIVLYCIGLVNDESIIIQKRKKASRSLSSIILCFLNFKGEKVQVSFVHLFLFNLYSLKFCYFYFLLYFFINLESITHLKFYCIWLVTLYNSITVYNCIFFRYYQHLQNREIRSLG